MRYEKPALVLVGEVATLTLGGDLGDLDCMGNPAYERLPAGIVPGMD